MLGATNGTILESGLSHSRPCALGVTACTKRVRGACRRQEGLCSVATMPISLIFLSPASLT